jgi:mono/diheme cytochrome c family protein
MRFSRLTHCGFIAVGLFLSVAAGAQVPADAGRGRALYENHCQVCHTSKVHSRADRLPMNPAELRDIVDRWQREEKLRWSEQDIADVVDYLNRSRYGYGTAR